MRIWIEREGNRAKVRLAGALRGASASALYRLVLGAQGVPGELEIAPVVRFARGATVRVLESIESLGARLDTATRAIDPEQVRRTPRGRDAALGAASGRVASWPRKRSRASSARRAESSPICRARIALGVLLLACSSELPDPLVPASHWVLDQAEAGAALGELAPSEQLSTDCDLPDTRSESPHFDFDESTLRPEGRFILDNVMICMLRGPLASAGVTLVGHADPRGTAAYNRALGMRRASAARDFLVLRGVMPARITIRSRGEVDALGTDPESWRLDRRVEIHVTSASAPALP